MGVEARAQGELKCLTGDSLRGAVDDEFTPGKMLVEVTLLQVQSAGEHRKKSTSDILSSLDLPKQVWDYKNTIPSKSNYLQTVPFERL